MRRGVQTDKHAAVAADQVVRALFMFDMVISLKTFTYIAYVQQVYDQFTHIVKYKVG